MTSPPPPTIPVTGKSDAGALSPGTKIFAASTTLLIGSAVAVACWKTSLEYDINPVMDRLLVSAPLPGELLPKAEAVSEMERSALAPVEKETVVAPLPSLAATPAMDSGNVKYAQAYPPPIYVSEKEVMKKETPKQAAASEVIPKKFINVSTEFKRVHSQAPTPPQTVRPKLDFIEPPQSASATEMSDALLPYFHSTENLKPMAKTGNTMIEPENPFQTAPSTVEPVEREALTPLKPIRSATGELTELKPRLKN